MSAAQVRRNLRGVWSEPPRGADRPRALSLPDAEVEIAWQGRHLTITIGFDATTRRINRILSVR